MKKLVIAIGLGLLAGSAYAACIGDNALCFGDGKVTVNGVVYIDGQGMTLPSKTVAAINASTATLVGQRITCTDCTLPYNTCISTSTNPPGAGSDYTLSTSTAKCI